MNTLSNTAKFGEYLRHNLALGICDFSLRAQSVQDGSVEFYIHPASISGYTRDYVVGATSDLVLNAVMLGRLAVMALEGTND